jgi:hypothetical protein
MGVIHINRGETHEAKHFFDRADRAATAQVEDEDLLVYLLGADARSVLKPVDLGALPRSLPEPGASSEYRPPGERYLMTNLIVVQARAGDDHNAALTPDRDLVGELERLLAQDPTRKDLVCALGRLYLARGEFAAAYSQFSSLIAERLGGHCNGANLDNSSDAHAPLNAKALERTPTRRDIRCELGMIRSWSWVMSEPPCGD